MKNCNRLIIISFLLIYLFIVLTGCFSNKNASSQIVITPETNNAYSVPENDGWILHIDEGTFDDEISLAIDPIEDSLSTHDFELIGVPVAIKVNDTENIRLQNPMHLEVPLTNEMMEKYPMEELFFGYYYDNQWEYYFPYSIDLDNHKAIFEIHHFSILGFGRPAEKDQLESFAKNMANKEYERLKRAQTFKENTSTEFDKVFLNMGVKSAKARNQLTADVLSYLENTYIDSSGTSPIDALAQMANSASQGEAGKLAYQNKLLEFTGKALIATLEKDTDKFSKSVNAVGNLATVAGALEGGDTKGALEGVGNLLKNAVPQAALAEATILYVVNKADQAINYWTESEIEKAYQVYIGKGAGKWGYTSGMEGDINAIFITMGGGQRMSDKKIIEEYCRRNGKDVDKLNQREKDKIISNARIALKEYFDQRIAKEEDMSKLIENEEVFIKALKDKGLLSASNYSVYFGLDNESRKSTGAQYSIQERLDRLYKIKNLVLGIMDEAVAEKITPEQLAYVIDRWIYYNEKKDREGFYEFMRKAKYIENVIAASENLAWVLTETKSNNWKENLDKINAENPKYRLYISASASNAVFKSSYLGPESGWMKTGYSQSGQLTWTSPSLTVIRPDDVVTLEIQSSHVSRDHANFAGIGSVVVQIFKIDEDDNQIDSAKYLYDDKGAYFLTSTSSVNYETLSATVKGNMPLGSEVGDRCVIRVSAAGGNVSVETWYIYEWKEL